jgi:lipid-binding SYLF domain-containing protein
MLSSEFRTMKVGVVRGGIGAMAGRRERRVIVLFTHVKRLVSSIDNLETATTGSSRSVSGVHSSRNVILEMAADVE